MSVAVPMMFVCRKMPGSSMERSTWLSAAKFTTMSGCSSSKRRFTASRSQMSAFTKRKFGLSITGASVERLPA